MAEKNDELRQFVVTPLQTNCYAYVSAGECLVGGPRRLRSAQVAGRLADVARGLRGRHARPRRPRRRRRRPRARDGRAPSRIHARRRRARAGTPGEMSEVGQELRRERARAPDRHCSPRATSCAVGTATFTVMETPGHTPGGVVLLGGGTRRGRRLRRRARSSRDSHGRTDLAGGDEGTIMASLAPAWRWRSDPATTLLCGHGPATTMARELRAEPVPAVRGLAPDSPLAPSQGRAAAARQRARQRRRRGSDHAGGAHARGVSLARAERRQRPGWARNGSPRRGSNTAELPQLVCETVASASSATSGTEGPWCAREEL